jgi:uncharacterized protein YbjT (DUF2867 family)
MLPLLNLLKIKKMTKILITGASGNVGMEVMQSLQTLDHDCTVVAGVRDIKEDSQKWDAFPVSITRFDLTDSTSFRPALAGCDVLFLLRPPQISDVEKYFKPLIDTCVQAGVKHIVFLSVQGVENSKLIPHHAIERLIVASKIPYTFLRPAYFMQNFTTTLRADLVTNRRIFLPAGKAKFTLVDVRDIGQVAAHILTNPAEHSNRAYDLTSNDKLTFGEMACLLSKHLETEIRFDSPNLIRFFLAKRKDKVPTMLILVLILLHYLPRFQKEPDVTGWVERLLKRKPISFEQFILDHKKVLLNSTR